MTRTINVAADFSRFPAGRFYSDGPNSGQRFREEMLLPSLKAGEKVQIKLDGALGYGSSFLEEAFGGLVRLNGFTFEKLKGLITLQVSDKSTEVQIWRCIEEAKPQ